MSSIFGDKPVVGIIMGSESEHAYDGSVHETA